MEIEISTVISIIYRLKTLIKLIRPLFRFSKFINFFLTVLSINTVYYYEFKLISTFLKYV